MHGDDASFFVCVLILLSYVKLNFMRRKNKTSMKNGDGDGGPMRFSRFNAYFNIIIILDKKIDEIQQRVYVCMHVHVL